MSNALDDLIAKVEAGTADRDWEGYQALYAAHWELTRKSYGGSLDAALALHNAVLPGWTVRLTATVGESKSFPYVHIFKMRETEDDLAMGANSSGYEGFCPARAALLAILRAMKEGKDA